MKNETKQIFEEKCEGFFSVASIFKARNVRKDFFIEIQWGKFKENVKE